ncbi:hypothetical protein [Brucella intermedia]|uniref:hypothetical protein n=1 Tax=Brucella intermedia TaxID=94625 RepID=UPI00224A7018|nr:hypothetical protein [Brucella intermedia]
MSDEKSRIFDAALALDEDLPRKSPRYSHRQKGDSSVPEDATDVPGTRDMTARRTKRAPK